MHPRGPNYLEDNLLAKLFDQEQKSILKLKELEAQASELYIKYLEMEEKGYINKLGELKNKLEQIQNTLKLELNNQHILKEEIHQLNNPSTAIIAKQLKIEAKTINPTALPYRIFTNEEMISINEHYKKLPSHLKKLMEAAVYDDTITFDLVPRPVYIRGEGRVYNHDVLMKLFKDNEEALAPISRIPFTIKDIIPCNTLIKSMEHLLSIISNRKLEPIVLDNKLASLNKDQCRNKIPAELVAIIEKNYSEMENKHKLLFNSTCRDPITHIIMDDPVILPDGYVYDKSTALAYVKYGKCPLNPDIKFKESDITSCHYVIEILEQLKLNIEKVVHKVSIDSMSLAP